jgi:saccharopine dehydrogenase-like NADP-dependent oxidoreductase
MKALVLGCGEMGVVAIEDLVRHGMFREVAVAARDLGRVEGVLAGLPLSNTVRTSAHRVDVQDHADLLALMKRFDVVCNLAGPNFRNAVPAARAAIGAGVPLVDVSDDWAATLDILALHDEARRAGVPIIVGLGASPGVTNVMARYGASRLDRVDEVHTAWIMRGSDLGGPACCAHLLYSLPDRAFVFERGRMHQVRPFADGRETLDFPELGAVEVMHIGHPEPFTLSRYLNGVRYADDKATFLPECTNELLVTLSARWRAGTDPEGQPIAGGEPLDHAAAYLHAWSKRQVDVPTTGALRSEVRGELAGRRTRVVYAAAGRIAIGTGIPASIGAHMLALGKVATSGVYPPEACVDPEWFFLAVSNRHVGEVREQIIQE